jgi:predicted metal-dependent hydrolase
MTPADPRFLEGVRLFNAREFFEAHEVWEDLWHEMVGADRRFVQGLIQAAVCAYHAGNGNARGAGRLFESARRYMTAYGATHWGVDVAGFWAAMAAALAEFVGDVPATPPRLLPDLLPSILIRPVD